MIWAASTSCAPIQSTTTTLVDDEKDGKAGQQRARPDRLARRDEGALDRAAKARDAEPLIGEGLQHAHRADQFGRIGRCVGERILGKARAAAHRAAEGVERQHDQRDRGRARKPDSRGLVTTIMTLAPRNSTKLRNATETEAADRGLDLRGVGGEPRDHFAGAWPRRRRRPTARSHAQTRRRADRRRCVRQAW